MKLFLEFFDGFDEIQALLSDCFVNCFVKKELSELKIGLREKKNAY